MRRLAIIVTLSLLLSPSASPAGAAFTTPPPTVQTSRQYADKIRLFEKEARRQMELDQIPGLTIGFVKDGFTWVRGFGYADLENKTPMRAESAYRLASV